MSRVPRHAEGRSAMVWALVVLGVLTLVFGAFVLLRFPDRPGGTITVMMRPCG